MGWWWSGGGGPSDFSDSPESKFLFPSLGLDLGLGLVNIGFDPVTSKST